MPKKYTVLRPIQFPIGPSIAYVPLNNGMFALIDRDDAPLVSGDDWYAVKSGRHASRIGYYARRGRHKHPRDMHLMILRPSHGMRGDHRSGNTLNNCRWNLHETTVTGNNRSRRVRHDSETGLRGVSKRGEENYISRVWCNGKSHYCGRHRTAQGASDAYVAKAKELFGDAVRLS